MTVLIHERDGLAGGAAVAAGGAAVPVLWREFCSARDRCHRDRLVLHYAPLVHHVAARVGTGLPAHVELADLEQSGVFGLIDAIERYEPDRGSRFETYAVPRIRGAIIDELRAQDWVPRAIRAQVRELDRAQERLEGRLQRPASDCELAGELGLALGELRAAVNPMYLVSIEAIDERRAVRGAAQDSVADVLADYAESDPAALLESQESLRTLARSALQLDSRDRRILQLYYFENRTLAQIGELLGVTESRICQLRARAVARLRTRFDVLSAA